MFCWKFIALCSSERILQIDQEKSNSHGQGGTVFLTHRVVIVNPVVKLLKSRWWKYTRVTVTP